jgi:WD40 repeat protein
MKLRPHHSSFGTIAAILLSLMPCGGGRAQHLPAQQSRGAGTEATPTPLVALSLDGEFFAVATPDGRIKCGRTREGAAKQRTFYQCNPSALVFSPDSRFLVVAGASRGCRAGLKVWNVEKGSELCLETEPGSHPLLSFSPDSLRLVTTGKGSTINLWDLTTGKRLWSVSTTRPILGLAFSKEAVVAVFADGSIQRFDLKTANERE